jgi:hypothetical protein
MTATARRPDHCERFDQRRVHLRGESAAESFAGAGDREQTRGIIIFDFFEEFDEPRRRFRAAASAPSFALRAKPTSRAVTHPPAALISMGRRASG